MANSLARRDGLPFEKALGVWFHYNIAALNAAVGLPALFLDYDRLLAAWEPELRRCATALAISWPADDGDFRKRMNTFIQPGLRHHRSSPGQLQQLPAPVRQLHDVLFQASAQPSLYDGQLDATVRRLFQDFEAYASFFANDADAVRSGVVMAWRGGNGAHFKYLQFKRAGPRPQLVQRILGDKLRRSICKRLAETCCWLQP